MILNYPIIIIDYYQDPLLIVATQVACNSPDSMLIAPSTLYHGFIIWLVLSLQLPLPAPPPQIVFFHIIYFEIKDTLWLY